jgi:hypothetical protein
MIVATWIVVGLLALANLLAGAAKLLTPEHKLKKSMPYIETVGIGWTRVAAVAEVAGAIGITAPLLLARTVTGWEWGSGLAVAAATGLGLVQILAIAVHSSRHEKITANIVLLLFATAAAILIARS